MFLKWNTPSEYSEGIEYAIKHYDVELVQEYLCSLTSRYFLYRNFFTPGISELFPDFSTIC